RPPAAARGTPHRARPARPGGRRWPARHGPGTPPGRGPAPADRPARTAPAATPGGGPGRPASPPGRCGRRSSLRLRRRPEVALPEVHRDRVVAFAEQFGGGEADRVDGLGLGGKPPRTVVGQRVTALAFHDRPDGAARVPREPGVVGRVGAPRPYPVALSERLSHRPSPPRSGRPSLPTTW